MNKNTQNSDQSSLKTIEELSKKISNLIYAGNYKKVSELDQLRLKFIKEFNSKNSSEFQSLVSSIRKKNMENIQNIENKFNSLQVERSKFVKRFKAYTS